MMLKIMTDLNLQGLVDLAKRWLAVSVCVPYPGDHTVRNGSLPRLPQSACPPAVKENFVDLVQNKGKVTLGKGTVQIAGMGTVTLQLSDEFGGNVLKMTNVLSVPDLQQWRHAYGWCVAAATHETGWVYPPPVWAGERVKGRREKEGKGKRREREKEWKEVFFLLLEGGGTPRGSKPTHVSPPKIKQPVSLVFR